MLRQPFIHQGALKYYGERVLDTDLVISRAPCIHKSKALSRIGSVPHWLSIEVCVPDMPANVVHLLASSPHLRTSTQTWQSCRAGTRW